MVERKLSFAFHKPFLIITKGRYWHVTIGYRKRDNMLVRKENFRLLKRKAKML